MTRALTYKTFREALSLFRLTKPNVYGCVMADHFPEEGRVLLDQGYLSEGPMTTIVPDRWSDELGDMVEAKWDPETRTYGYFNVSAMGVEWINPPEEDLKTYDINLDWMADHIRDLIGIESTVQARAIIPKLFWELGHIWIGRQKSAVFLAQNLSGLQEFDRVYDALLDWPGKSPGVILTNDAPERRHAELPGGHRILSLKDIVVETASGCEMDMELVHGTLKGTQVSKKTGPLNYSVDYSSITVNGREYTFTGGKQRRVLKILIQAWKTGNPKCRTMSVMAQAETTAETIGQLFHKRSDWKDLIGYGGGYCWIKA